MKICFVSFHRDGLFAGLQSFRIAGGPLTEGNVAPSSVRTEGGNAFPARMPPGTIEEVRRPSYTRMKMV
jgi:hypothetical protein